MKEQDMTNLSRSEMRLLSRVIRINMSKRTRWSTVAGGLFILLAVAEIVLAYVNKSYEFNFWRMFGFTILGESIIETSRLYRLIQKLAT